MDPATGYAERYSSDVRWPALLEHYLDRDYEVISEALPGRTTGLDDPEMPSRNGMSYFHPCLLSHRPLSMVVIMLGSNDLKPVFNTTPKQITQRLESLCHLVENHYIGMNGTTPAIMIIAPAHIQEDRLTLFMQTRFQGATPKSQQLPHLYQELARKNGYYFYDASYLSNDLGPDSDGIHLDKKAHQQLARAMANQIKPVFEDSQL
jgi:lysophospholipase L1-like esterase